MDGRASSSSSLLLLSTSSSRDAATPGMLQHHRQCLSRMLGKTFICFVDIMLACVACLHCLLLHVSFVDDL